MKCCALLPRAGGSTKIIVEDGIWASRQTSKTAAPRRISLRHRRSTVDGRNKEEGKRDESHTVGGMNKDAVKRFDVQG